MKAPDEPFKSSRHLFFIFAFLLKIMCEDFLQFKTSLQIHEKKKKSF